jgi:hypothetical protein
MRTYWWNLLCNFVCRYDYSGYGASTGKVTYLSCVNCVKSCHVHATAELIFKFGQ